MTARKLYCEHACNSSAALPKERKQGFTLIELLVVIAIIAILAAILFPVFSRVRDKGRQASCGSNMRQITLATLMYADDNKDTLPALNAFRADVNLGPSGDFVKGALYGYLKAKTVLLCPSVNGREKRKYLEQNRRPMLFNYTVNGYTTWAGHDAGMRGLADSLGMKITMFPNTSRTIHMVDENTDTNEYNVATNDELFIWIDRTTTRHGGRANVTFLDGHVGTVPGMSEWNTATWRDGTSMFQGPNLVHP